GRRQGELTSRGHDVDVVAGFETVVHEIGECAPGDPLHHGAQLTVVQSGADRIGTADVLTPYGRAQGQVLARQERVGTGQPARYRESERYRVLAVAVGVADAAG